jgi:hypothetical protein
MTSTLADLVDRGWRDVLAWLPPNIDDLARETKGFLRPRGVRTATDVLRLGLVYSVLDLSLRSVAVWATTHGIARMSDVAVLNRLRQGEAFFAAVFAAMLSRQIWAPPTKVLPWRVRIVDASTVSAPGAENADWRLHVGYDAARGVVDRVELTDGHGGEHLKRVAPGPGEVLVGDRGYAHAGRIIETLEAGAHLVIRVGHSAVPLVDDEGRSLAPAEWAGRKRSQAGRPPRVESVGVYLRDDKERRFPLRLVVARKSQVAVDRERARIKRVASKKGKTPTDLTMFAAKYTFILTSLPDAEVDAASVADLYRVRWQIELAFKRWKSLLGLDALRARDPELARAYLYAKLVAVALMDNLARASRAFSPWGVPLSLDSVEDLGVGAPRAGRRDHRVRPPPPIPGAVA